MGILLSEEEIRRAVRRMAHEIIERNEGSDKLVIIGIKTRGIPLANRLKREIEQIEGKSVESGEMDVTLYRDDIFTNDNIKKAGSTDIKSDINGKTVIIADDVLYTGRTVRAAINGIMELGRPGKIQLAVLVDRGHREMPFRADFVGKNIPTSREERVNVTFKETDGTDAVTIYGRK